MLGLLVDIAVGGTASAASFSCTRIASPRDDLICRNPILSRLDERLGHDYRERLALLSPDGAKLLQDSERRWLRFTAVICPTNAPTPSSPQRSAETCLERQYVDRLKQVGKAGTRLGPFVFNRVDLYAAESASDDGTGWAPGFYVHHVAYPQIDDPRTIGLQAWNKRIARHLAVDNASDEEDDDADYEVGYASERLISVRWVESQYGHGRSHGLFETRTDNLVLRPTLHALAAQDVFGPGNDWVDTLKDLFWNKMRRSGGRQPEESARNAIEEDFVRPDEWLFSPDGITVAFTAYEGGCYICTPDPVTLTWAELKPLLRHDAVVP